jgi:PAS domain S-box-containing protein
MSATSPAVDGLASPSALAPAEKNKLLEEWKRVAGQLFLACREAVTLVDTDGKILAWNPSAERLYGWKESEAIGKVFLDLVNAELPRPLAQIENILRREGYWEYELKQTPRPGAQIVVAKRTEQQLRVVSGHLFNLRDEERRKLGRDLHDSAGQLLSMAKLNLSLAQEHLQSASDRGKSYVEESCNLIDQALSEVRTISYLLHPPLLEELGLAGVLPWYVTGFSQRSRIQVALDMPREMGRLPREVELGLFRIVQECLTNVHRHSNSSTATISLSLGESQVRLKIADQGKGMAATSAESGSERRSGGVGLSGIRERVANLGGHMQIRSGDWGTAIEVIFPCGEMSAGTG